MTGQRTIGRIQTPFKGKNLFGYSDKSFESHLTLSIFFERNCGMVDGDFACGKRNKPLPVLRVSISKFGSVF